MAEQNTDLLPWPLVIDVLKKLKPSETKSQSLAQQLIAEDLLMRVPGFDLNAGEEFVRFAYQRFSDFTIVSEMLRENKFGEQVDSKLLERHLREAEWFPTSRDWIEAFATLSPEFYGRELPEIGKGFVESPALRSAFLHSVVWRKRANVRAIVGTRFLIRSQACWPPSPPLRIRLRAR